MCAFSIMSLRAHRRRAFAIASFQTWNPTMGFDCLASFKVSVASWCRIVHLAATCRELLRARFLRACAQEWQRVQYVRACVPSRTWMRGGPVSCLVGGLRVFLLWQPSRKKRLSQNRRWAHRSQQNFLCLLVCYPFVSIGLSIVLTILEALFSSELAAYAAVCCISAYPLLPAVGENLCLLTPGCHSSGWKDERCPRRSSGCEGAMPVETLAGDLVPQLSGKIWTRAHSYSL